MWMCTPQSEDIIKEIKVKNTKEILESLLYLSPAPPPPPPTPPPLPLLGQTEVIKLQICF